MTDDALLPEPATYFPVEARFAFKVGLARLGADFGNGVADGRVFQLDRRWRDYRAVKLAARRERLSKYVCRSSRFTPAARRAVTALVVERLVQEYPALFRSRRSALGLHLDCRLTGERLALDEEGNLLWAATGAEPAYVDALDALLCQVQEDIAFVACDGAGDRLAYLHLCQPNHWRGEDKLDGDFRALHAPVPSFRHIARQSRRLVQTMAGRGPFVRFAWGLATDDRLNHHPDPPPGWDAADWHGRCFEPAAPRLFLRVERQVSIALPQVGGFVFTIRTYVQDVSTLPAAARATLAAALETMDGAIADYKGLANRREALTGWLRQGIGE